MDKDKSCARLRSCYKILITKVCRNVFKFFVVISLILAFVLEKLSLRYTLCSGLQEYLNEQGFNIVGYGCTTCIGNSGEINESVGAAITENGIIEIQNYICFGL